MRSLWFIYAHGCDACAATAPEVVAAARTIQARVQVPFYPMNLNAVLEKGEWGAKNWMPRYTPSLVFLPGRRAFDARVDVLEGAQTAPQIERWVMGRLKTD